MVDINSSQTARLVNHEHIRAPVWSQKFSFHKYMMSERPSQILCLYLYCLLSRHTPPPRSVPKGRFRLAVKHDAKHHDDIL